MYNPFNNYYQNNYNAAGMQQIPSYPQNMQQNIQSQNNLLKVQGYEGAKSFQMAPNSTIALFDANDDIFYVKVSDAGGFSSIKAYRFTPIEDNALKNNSVMLQDYVTRAEFEELKGMIENGQQFVQQPTKTSQPKQSNANASTIPTV